MLTVKNINVLIEALEEWEKSPLLQSMNSSIVKTIISSIASDSKEDIKKEIIKDQSDAERKKTLRSEERIMITAELIKMRNEILLEELSQK